MVILTQEQRDAIKDALELGFIESYPTTVAEFRIALEVIANNVAEYNGQYA